MSGELITESPAVVEAKASFSLAVRYNSDDDIRKVIQTMCTKLSNGELLYVLHYASELIDRFVAMKVVNPYDLSATRQMVASAAAGAVKKWCNATAPAEAPTGSAQECEARSGGAEAVAME